MAGSSTFYNSGIVDVMDGTVTLAVATDIRAMLTLSSYTPTAASEDFLDDVSASKAVCDTPGDVFVALTNEGVTINTSSTPDASEFDADDVVFSAVDTAQTVGGVVIYKHNAAEGSAALICYIAITNTDTNGGDITVEWATPQGATAGGILNIPVS